MSGSTRRWIWIVGIIVLVLVLAVVLPIAGGFFFFKDSLNRFEAADLSHDDLTATLGEVSGFAPTVDGGVTTERIELFLTVREELAGRRTALSGSLQTLSAPSATDGECEESSLFSKVAAGARLPRQLSGYHQERNEALQRHGLSLGEYYYLYTLVYYSWLGRDVGDGPSFELVGSRGYVLEKIEPEDASVVRARRHELADASLHRLMIPALRRQLERLSTTADAIASADWHDRLEAEIAALAADPDRMVWADSLPPTIEQTLAPYRDRLEQSYDEMTNALDIGLLRREISVTEVAARK